MTSHHGVNSNPPSGQSKDVDSTHTDRGDGYTHYEGDDCTPSKAVDSSLREQIQRLIVENRNSLNDHTTTEPYDMNGIADDFIELLTTYVEAERNAAVAQFIASDDYHGLIEAAEIEARCEEADIIENWLGDFDDNEFTIKGYDQLNQLISRRYRELQAQKAVLGDSTDKLICTCGHNEHTNIVIQGCETCSCQEFTAVLEKK